jgi:hypothetical protein
LGEHAFFQVVNGFEDAALSFPGGLCGLGVCWSLFLERIAVGVWEGIWGHENKDGVRERRNGVFVSGEEGSQKKCRSLLFCIKSETKRVGVNRIHYER